MTVQQAGNPALISKGIVAPGWTPADRSTGAVEQAGYASTQVLAGAIQAGIPSSNSSLQSIGKHPDNVATGLGRVGAHEAGHYFLQLINHPGQGLMRAGFTGNQWFSSGENATFQFTTDQVRKLSRLCH